MVVGTVWVGLKLLINWHFNAQQSTEIIQNAVEKQTASSKWQFHGWKYLFDDRGQSRRTRLVSANRKVVVTQMTTLYHVCEQKSILDQTKRWVGYSADFNTLSQEQGIKAAVGTDSLTLDSWRLGGKGQWFSNLQLCRWPYDSCGPRFLSPEDQFVWHHHPTVVKVMEIQTFLHSVTWHDLVEALDLDLHDLMNCATAK